MANISYYARKLKGHYREKGVIGGTVWFARAVRFRTKMYVAKKLKIDLNNEGNLNESVVPKYHIPKTEKRVFIFGTVPYYDIGGGQRSAQLAKTMNSLGYRVYYIFGTHSSESVVHKMEIPTLVHKYVGDYSIDAFSDAISDGDLVVFEFPKSEFLPFLHIAKKKKAKVIYENIDNWETSLGGGVFSRKNLDVFLKDADLLVGTATFLVDQLKGYCKELNIKKKIIYSPNAVNDSLFDPRMKYEIPEDFIMGEKTLIYYGSLWGEWFDWDLLFGTAKKFPKYSFLIIGEKENILHIVEKAPKNVHFLGIKKQSELPAYLQYCEYSLIPFKVDKIGEAVSPLKVFEYIAMNTTVISTSLPEVAGYPNTYCGNTIEEWSSIIRKNPECDTEASRDFIDENNWFSRCTQMLANIGIKTCILDGKLSVVILNHNNMNCIFDCVDCIRKHTKKQSYEIIIVDNDSTDGSFEKLKQKYKDNSDVKIIKNKKNGCSRGRNLGVEHSSGKYLLFLDSDQFVKHDFWLDQFSKIIENDNVGAVSWGAGWINTKKHFDDSPIVDNYPYRGMPANMSARTDIDYLATCGQLMLRSVFDETGGFDERYDPTCYEDTDLSYAIKDRGYDILYSPYLGVHHLPHQTTESGEFEHEALLEKHRKIFLDKWKEINPSLLERKK